MKARSRPQYYRIKKIVNYETGPDGGLMLPPFQMMPTELPSRFAGKVMQGGPTFGAE